MAQKNAESARPSILVVDDENGPRQALRMLLKEDHDVHLAEDVQTALNILEQKPVDLVITDIRMPQQTGVDLLQLVKESHPETQVIILTGFAHLDTAMQAVEYGAFAYLEKPFDNETMLRHIRAGLQKRRQEMERRILERLAIEANRFETLGRMISGMIHDMGTPLSVVGAQIEMILNQPDRGDLSDRLSTMHSQIKYCGEMVRSAMDMLRCEPRPVAPFVLNDIVEVCLDVARPLLHGQRVEVKCELASGIASLIGDPALLRQAVLNLVTNSCYAMDDLEETPELALRTWQEGEYAYLSVRDKGPGIPKEFQDQIFETFFTTKGNRGTGLGLAVVQNVMGRHNGSVSVSNCSDGGALFILRFPVPSHEEIVQAFRQAHGGKEGPV
ncbi:MAG: response regulator [Nitrospiraceae bacterium]|nr:response regulator [Nitrospiraceae bacterium]